VKSTVCQSADFPDTTLTLFGMSNITMYGADWCGDCRRAKQWFERNKVAYAWVDLDAHPESIDEVIRYNGGRKNIPVVVFPDGSHVTEPTDADLTEKHSGMTARSSSRGAI
jgi:mycoredoxin